MASKLAHTSFLSSSKSGARCRPLKKQISLFCFSFWVCTTVFFSKKPDNDDNSKKFALKNYGVLHHGVVTCLVCQKLCTGLFTCPYGAKTIALPACHALGCPVCQPAKVSCTAGTQWEKFVISRFVKHIIPINITLYQSKKLRQFTI